MDKTSALKCGKCPKYSSGKCEITGRAQDVNNNCDVNSSSQDTKNDNIQDNKRFVFYGY